MFWPKELIVLNEVAGLLFEHLQFSSDRILKVFLWEAAFNWLFYKKPWISKLA